MAAILSPLSLYGGNRKTKLPLLQESKIHTPKGTFGILVIAPSDGCRATAPRLTSTHALRSRHMSCAFELSQGARIPSLHVEPLVLVLWLNQVTRRFWGEPPQMRTGASEDWWMVAPTYDE
jgi:hypothetical protein